jgi:hypothetical protein
MIPTRCWGDLYRITTETGHVKWVCFAHYKETYRQTALDAFIQAVEAAAGVYDPHMRKVTISLTSSTSAKDFFRRLIKQDSAIDILGVSLDWKFGSSDLEMIVDKLGHSNVKAFNLDLKDYNSVKKIKLFPTLQPGKGRYHSLLGLLSNTKLRGLSFTNLSMLSTRTSDLPSNQRPSLLRVSISCRVLIERSVPDRQTSCTTAPDLWIYVSVHLVGKVGSISHCIV